MIKKDKTLKRRVECGISQRGIQIGESILMSKHLKTSSEWL